VLYGVEEHFPNNNIDITYVYVGYFFLFTCLVCFYYAYTVSPGVVNKKNNSALYQKYGEGSILFVKGDCSTCKIPK
jgi:hypothetical protein